ncbi:MAG: RNA methyltransferase [Limnobacter sp.]|nr:RNA methyltransferase [Limnobacter sp.]
MTQTVSLSSISIVLVKTSHPGNVGSVARAMKTMGLTDLRLVEPKDPLVCQHEEALALSSGAQDVLGAARVFASLPDALDDVNLSYALSARLRELGPVLQNPVQAAAEGLSRLSEGHGVAFVFGAERTGLSNEELLLCNRQVYIPGNPEYNSLNLAQAVQIVSYALRQQWLNNAENNVEIRYPEKVGGKAAVRATGKAVTDLRDHWVKTMEAVDFINPKKPKKLIERLTRMLARVELEREEVDMLRGFLSDVNRVAEGRLYPHEAERSKNSLDDC